MPPPPTILTLVRHGETPANLDGVWHGSTDSPLTPRGEAQAQAVAGYVETTFPDAVEVYSSHLQRARRTAEAIGERLELDVRVDPDLGEYCLGSWEGKTYASLFTEYKLFENMKSDPDFAPHGGESPRRVAERFGGALRRIAAGHPARRVIVVAHGGALAIALGHLIDDDYREWRKVMDNCAVSELVLEPAPDLLSFNHTDHLEGLQVQDDDDDGPFDGPVVVPIETSIDLHRFRPEEIGEVVDAYLEAAVERGLREVRLIHGRGRGVQRHRVRIHLERSPWVERFAEAPEDRGGWGATLAWLKPRTP